MFKSVRPNVAAGAAVGLLVPLALAWIGFYQRGDLDLPADLPDLLATFVPLIAAVVAAAFPALDKVLGAAIAIGATILLIIVLALALGVPLNRPILVAIAAGGLQLLVTGFVSNTGPPIPPGATSRLE